MVGVGVFAHVHGGQLQPEGGQGAQEAFDAAVGDQRAAVGAQRGLQDGEVGEQFAGTQVVAVRVVGQPPGEAFAGVEELLPDAGGLEPVGLLGVEPLVARADLREVRQVLLEGVEEFAGGAAVADAVGQGAAQPVHVLQGVGDAVFVLQEQHVPGDLRGDVGVAVAVSADPGAEGQRAAAGGQRRAGPLEFGGQILQDVADGALVEFVEVVDGVAGLVGGFGAGDAQFVGLPDEVDVLGEAQVGAALVEGVGVLQQFGDGAQLGEDRAAGGLGGVGGEDGTDAQGARRGRAGGRGRRP